MDISRLPLACSAFKVATVTLPPKNISQASFSVIKVSSVKSVMGTRGFAKAPRYRRAVAQLAARIGLSTYRGCVRPSLGGLGRSEAPPRSLQYPSEPSRSRFELGQYFLAGMHLERLRPIAPEFDPVSLMLSIASYGVPAGIQRPKDFLADVGAIAGFKMRNRENATRMCSGGRMVEFEADFPAATAGDRYRIRHTHPIWNRIAVTVSVEGVLFDARLRHGALPGE